MSNDKIKDLHICPMCGNPHIDPKEVMDNLRSFQIHIITSYQEIEEAEFQRLQKEYLEGTVQETKGQIPKGILGNIFDDMKEG